jgi:hypothetical protein
VCDGESQAEGVGELRLEFCFQELELSKDGEVSASAESGFEFGQSSDFVAQEMLAESLGIEREWAHNVRVPIQEAIHSEL